MKVPESLFPFEQVREIQSDFMNDVASAIKEKKHMVAHAPTGLGKTVATLAPALKIAMEKDLTIFFLTSRHTQQEIVLETLKKIREKCNLEFTASSIIGKKWMCSQPGVERLGSSEFSEFCKSLCADDQCEFFLNTKTKIGISAHAQRTVSELQVQSPCSSGLIVQSARQQALCPYEIGAALAKKARVIITDYFYIFHPTIRQRFLNTIGKDLDRAILIVDEGHNLPERLRDLMSDQLSTGTIKAALKEVQKFQFDDIENFLLETQAILEKLGENLQINQEKRISKELFVNEIKKITDYEELTEHCHVKGDVVREEQKRSAIGNMGNFLEQWLGPEDGYARILQRKGCCRERPRSRLRLRP